VGHTTGCERVGGVVGSEGTTAHATIRRWSRGASEATGAEDVVAVGGAVTAGVAATAAQATSARAAVDGADWSAEGRSVVYVAITAVVD
jgi:hypothetical protein